MLAPHRDLAASVQTYWILRATRILAPLLRYMHPDGGSGITLNFGEVVWIGDVPRPHGVSAAARVFVPEALRIYGNVRIENIARRLDLTERHLERLFREQVGVAPKQLARIVRARSARDVIRKSPGIELSAVAYELGYSDQAHFTREFKAIIGLAPADYRRRLKRSAHAVADRLEGDA